MSKLIIIKVTGKSQQGLEETKKSEEGQDSPLSIYKQP